MDSPWLPGHKEPGNPVFPFFRIRIFCHSVLQSEAFGNSYELNWYIRKEIDGVELCFREIFLSNSWHFSIFFRWPQCPITQNGAGKCKSGCAGGLIWGRMAAAVLMGSWGRKRIPRRPGGRRSRKYNSSFKWENSFLTILVVTSCLLLLSPIR